jgi:hypothetical protein
MLISLPYAASNLIWVNLAVRPTSLTIADNVYGFVWFADVNVVNKSAPCHKNLYTIPGSWKYPSSSMARILTRHAIHWAYLGMLWIGMYSVVQFRPISSNFAQPLKSGTSHRPQTTESTLCKGDVSHCLRQMLVTLDCDWFSGPRPYPFKDLYSQACKIHRLGPIKMYVNWPISFY